MPPCDYSKYSKNWHSVIRPAILERAENKCEFCKVENKREAFRAFLNGVEVYQYDNGDIHNAETGDYIMTSFYEDLEPSTGKEEQLAIKIVLTVAHLDHDITNNDYSNLRALCQQCHLRYDAKHHAKTRKYGNDELQGKLI